jgi:glycosyltransferase involved in cell wall biosynthesis
MTVAPKISILLPAFNAQEWIADSLGSALAQTWPNKEIIVVDDGSVDSTLAIARNFASRHVRVFTQERAGGQAARNRAFAECQGDYIQWLDADDLLDPDKITLQMKQLDRCRSRRTLLCSEWGRFVCLPRRARFTATELWRDATPAEFLMLKLGRNLFMQTATWLVSRELTESTGPWDTTLSVDQDGEYFARMLLHSDGVRFVPGSRVFYRKSGRGSVSDLGRSKQKQDDLVRSLNLQISYLLALENSERTKAACTAFLQNEVESFYFERPDLVRDIRRLTADLGGELRPPRVSMMYSLLAHVCGHDRARQARLAATQVRWLLTKSAERLLMHVEAALRST